MLQRKCPLPLSKCLVKHLVSSKQIRSAARDRMYGNEIFISYLLPEQEQKQPRGLSPSASRRPYVWRGYPPLLVPGGREDFTKHSSNLAPNLTPLRGCSATGRCGGGRVEARDAAKSA